MKTFILIWLGLLPLFAWNATTVLSAGNSETKVTAQQLYRQGKVSLKASRYSEAIYYFKRLIAGFTTDPLVPSARKYLAIAYSAQRKPTKNTAKTQRMTQGADQPKANIKLVLQPLVPAEKPTTEAQQAGPVQRGDPANCKPHPQTSNRHRYCNWYDALAYCKGKLPNVIALQEINYAECPAGKHDGLCGCRHWSSEEVDSSYAKTVIFGNGGEINNTKKTVDTVFVLCSEFNGRVCLDQF